MLNQQLAYPAATIEPFTDVTRDEGEPRLGLLRELFATASEDTKEQFATLFSALFSPLAARPRVCLCRVGSVRCTPEGVRDVIGNEAASAVRRVPVQSSETVALFSSKITSQTNISSFLAVEFSGASLRISRTSEHGVSIRGTGAVDDDVEVEFVDLASDVLARLGLVARLFEPPPVDQLAVALLPRKPHELPGDIMSDVADFWTRIIRAHVVVAVCAPNNAAWPLAFDNMRVYTSPDAKKDTQLALYATLHAASVTCACALHGLPPPTVEQDSEVELCLSMCGRMRAVRPDKSMEDCPMHRRCTPNTPTLSSICCANTSASLVCWHRSRSLNGNRQRQAGIRIQDFPLNGIDVLHAQHLLWAAGRCTRFLNTHKLTETEIANTCGKCTKALRNRLNDDVEAKRQKTGNKEDESRLVELDQMAVTALRNENTKKSCPSVLTDTHLGWFRHPPKRPRSHQ